MARGDGLLLHLVRHAHAGDPGAWEGDDDARPLTDKGRQQAERLGLHLSLAGFDPDAIVSSPRLRAIETAELLGAALGVEPTIDRRLAGPLDPAVVAAIVHDAGDPASPVLVGHDPDLTDLLRELTGANAEMKKAALVRIELRHGVTTGGGALRWLLPPDLLPPEG